MQDICKHVFNVILFNFSVIRQCSFNTHPACFLLYRQLLRPPNDHFLTCVENLPMFHNDHWTVELSDGR